MQSLELLTAINKIGLWFKVLMKIFIKTFDICQEANLTEGPTNYILLVREDRLDSTCITFRQIPSVSLSKPPYCSHCSFCNTHPGSRCRGGVRGNEPGGSKARRPVTFECGLPLLHIATLADASQKVSSAGLETWIRGRNNGWLTIARRNAH